MIDIDLGALVGREDRKPVSNETKEFLANKTYLVTGGGGSIGSELVRQLAELSGKVYILDREETALLKAEMSLGGVGLLEDDRLILADIRDRMRMEKIMNTIKPDVVFHAAAHKHLTLLQRYPAEAVKTNVFGTMSVLSAAARAEVKTFINVSTDKAADPSSVLGASKLIAEMLTQDLRGSMNVASVRFGNVLGSAGSLIPIIATQLEQGYPLTVTDAQAERYFMTISEAASLIIEASRMARDGQAFVLRMGQPVNIYEFVKKYAAMYGKPDAEIILTGLRPGEKRSEILFSETENLTVTDNPGIMASEPRHLVSGFDAMLAKLEADVFAAHDEALMADLRALVGENGTL